MHRITNCFFRRDCLFIILLCFLFLICPASAACAAENEIISKELFAMDTYMNIQAYGKHAEEALDAAEEEILSLERLLSAEDPDSEIAALNKNGGGAVSQPTEEIIAEALTLWAETGGKFDFSIYPVKEAWGFSDQNYRIPSEEELKALLPLVDASKVIPDTQKHTVTYSVDGMKIDAGALAKGYTSQRIMEIFAQHDVNGLVNLGGNVQSRGSKPDGSAWKVGIIMPKTGDEESGISWLPADNKNVQAGEAAGLLGIVRSTGQAVITSGLYERYFVSEGQLCHHILDPDTGYPSDTDLVSATIICTEGMKADGLSTSMFLLGRDKAVEYWKENPDAFDMILLKNDGSLYITAGIAEAFTSDMTYEVIQP